MVNESLTGSMISERLRRTACGDTLWAVPEREHPAAKAGRFVRAAGLAGAAAARELERQSAAKSEKQTERQPPPPALNTTGLLARTVFVGFLLSLTALVLAGLRVDSLIGGGDARLVFRLVVASILFVEAYFLTSNVRASNQRLAQRLLTRVWGRRGAVTRREKTFARIVRDALTLVGIAFLAAAIFELLSATIGS